MGLYSFFFLFPFLSVCYVLKVLEMFDCTDTVHSFYFDLTANEEKNGKVLRKKLLFVFHSVAF